MSRKQYINFIVHIKLVFFLYFQKHTPTLHSLGKRGKLLLIYAPSRREATESSMPLYS